MRISGSIFDPLRPERGTPTTNPSVPRSGENGGQSPLTGLSKSDSVQFSEAGRSMASRLDKQEQSAFDPERIAELRTKVLNGAYNTLDVVDQVARRVLARGDI